MATSVEARKAVERPCAREARHHDNPSLEPGCAVRKITFLKQPRKMGLLMIKQLSSDYYASKLELPWIMPEEGYGALGRESYLFRSGRTSRILDSCLFHAFRTHSFLLGNQRTGRALPSIEPLERRNKLEKGHEPRLTDRLRLLRMCLKRKK